MLSARFCSVLSLTALTLMLCSCLEQYDPKANNARFEKEWQQSEQLPPKLTDAGEIPAKGATSGPSIDQVFLTNCSGCHGATGHGDGPAGAALNPHPRNFTDKAWQAKVTDEHIANVIEKGGAANGLSAIMPPWGSVLSADQIKAMVGKIRAFGK